MQSREIWGTATIVGAVPQREQVQARTNVAVEPELGVDHDAVSAALAAWRRKAADLLMIAAAVHLPTMVLLMLGYGAPMPRWLRDTTIPIYLVLVAVALFRTVNYRTRLLVFFVAIYVCVAILSFAGPPTPMLLSSLNSARNTMV